MRVRFAYNGTEAEELYKALRDELYNYYRSYVPDESWTSIDPYYDEENREAILELTTGNTWRVALEENTVYIEYKGSRRGFWMLTPFAKFILPPSLKLVKILANEPPIKPEGVVLQISPLGLLAYYKGRNYLFEVVEYETTTPKEWRVEWYELVLQVDEQHAVIVNPFNGFSTRKVPYIDVYNMVEDMAHLLAERGLEVWWRENCINVEKNKVFLCVKDTVVKITLAEKEIDKSAFEGLKIVGTSEKSVTILLRNEKDKELLANAIVRLLVQ